MASSGTTLPPHSQWKPSEFQLNLKLSPDSLKKEVPFFSLISNPNGFVIPPSTSFIITKASGVKITVQISIPHFGNRERDRDHIAFCTSSDLRDVSATCSKLNKADASKCKITATLSGKDKVVFSIIPSSENAEKDLKKFFSIFEN